LDVRQLALLPALTQTLRNGVQATAFGANNRLKFMFQNEVLQG
jgi:hypothetical protein